MNNKKLGVILLIVSGLFGFSQADSTPAPKPDKSPKSPNAPLIKPVNPAPNPAPRPNPDPKPAPRPSPGPWVLDGRPSVEGDDNKNLNNINIEKISEGSKISPDGLEIITCDVPVELRRKNVGGRDGAGLCVFTSIEYAARYQNVRELWNFQDDMRKELGGGYPDKVTKMIAKYGKKSDGTIVEYIQDETGDKDILYAIIDSGRLPCVTYNGHDCHYNGSIAHMVTLPHFSKTWACVLDNNFIKDDQLVWMTPEEFLKRYNGGGRGWCVCLTHVPPPPVPHNKIK